MHATETLRTEERAVRDFDQVHLTGMGELTIAQGDDEGLTVQAEEQILPYIETVVQDRKLTIGLRRQGQHIRPTSPIRFDLRLRDLKALTISGSGSAQAESLRSERLEFVISGSGSAHLNELMTGWLGTTISGSGSLHVSGETPEHHVKISGSGGVDAHNLRTQQADITVSGSGAATVAVAKKLSAVISGSGSVAYSGNAHVSQVTSGSGRVRAL